MPLLPGDDTDLSGQEVRLTLLHTSDIHSRLVPYNFSPLKTDVDLGLIPDMAPFGGASRIAAVLRRERANADRVLHLDSGDCFQGAPIFNQNSGEVEFAGVRVGAWTHKQIARAGGGQAGWTQPGERIALIVRAVVGEMVQQKQGQVIAGGEFAQGNKEGQGGLGEVALASSRTSSAVMAQGLHKLQRIDDHQAQILQAGHGVLQIGQSALAKGRPLKGQVKGLRRTLLSEQAGRASTHLQGAFGQGQVEDASLAHRIAAQKRQTAGDAQAKLIGQQRLINRSRTGQQRDANRQESRHNPVRLGQRLPEQERQTDNRWRHAGRVQRQRRRNRGGKRGRG